jgi:WhiB family transcriptional regulator, redox-sensing transcriptional regulator
VTPAIRRVFAGAFADQLAADQIIQDSAQDWTIARATRLTASSAHYLPRHSTAAFTTGSYRVSRAAYAARSAGSGRARRVFTPDRQRHRLTQANDTRRALVQLLVGDGAARLGRAGAGLVRHVQQLPARPDRQGALADGDGRETADQYQNRQARGEAAMQWREASVAGANRTGFEASGSDSARRKPDVRQIQVGHLGLDPMASQVRPVTGPGVGKVSVIDGSDQFVVAGPATELPMGLDLPCTEDPEMFFAESPQDVEQAKAMCRGCRVRTACLAGALERREPCGVWGGELLIRGAIVPVKRPRGRPRKTEVAA